MYTLEDIEQIIKPENLIACRGDKKNPFDMHIDGANYYKHPETEEIYRLTKKTEPFLRVLEKINDTDTKILNLLKNNPNQKIYQKKATDKDIWFFNVSTNEKDESFFEKHKAIESECKKDNFVKRSNKNINYLQRKNDKKKTTQNNLTNEQLDRIVQYENIIAIEGTDPKFITREGNSQKSGVFYYQDPEDSNIVVQESIISKPVKLIVVNKEKKLQQIKEKKEIVTIVAHGNKKAVKLYPKTSEINFKENYEGFRAKYPVGSAIIKIGREKEESIDISTLEGKIKIEEATKLDHLIAYKGRHENNMFNIRNNGKLYYLEDLNHPEAMVVQKISEDVKKRGWYNPSEVEINAVMTSIKKNGVIKFNAISEIYPITSDKKEKKEFIAEYEKFDGLHGLDGKYTVKNRDKIGKKTEPRQSNSIIELTPSEIKALCRL